MCWAATLGYPFLAATSLSHSALFFLSLSLSIPLCLPGQLVTGILCVEGSFVVFDLFVCLRSLDPINYVVSLAGAISLSPSSPLSLCLALCALQFGGFLQSAIVLIVCLKLA